jgi:hypothetical protein
MRIRNALVAAAAAVPIAMLAATSPAGAATPSCGHDCVNVFSKEFGHGYILDVLHAQARVGQPIILFQASSHDGAQDFTYAFQGRVSDFYAVNLVSGAVELHYANNPAFEIEYSPYGRGSGLCVGVATTASRRTPVSLQPCGASAKTVWIVTLVHAPGGHPHALGGQTSTPTPSIPGHGTVYVALINGSGTNFSHPFVLNYPGNGAAPWDRPRPQLTTDTLSSFSNGTVFDNQQWSGFFGTVH